MFFFKIKITFTYLCMYIHLWGWGMCHGLCMEVSVQLSGVGSQLDILAPCWADFGGGVSKRVTCGRSYKELPPVDRRLPGEVLWWQSQPWFVRVPSPDVTFLCEMEAEQSCTFSRFTACGLMIWPAIRCCLLCTIPRNHTLQHAGVPGSDLSVLSISRET